MLEEGNEPYIKLIWLLNDTSRCNKHYTLLQYLCPHCKKQQCLSTNRESLMFCSYCKSELTTTNTDMDIGASWHNYGNDMSQFLIEYCSNYDPNAKFDINKSFIPTIGLARSIRFLTKYSELTINKGFEASYHAIQKYCNGISDSNFKRFSLLTVRRIAHSCDVSLYTLLSGNVHNSSAFISNEVCNKTLPDYLGPQSICNKNDHLKVRADAIELINSMSLPLSLKALSQKLGVTVGYLEYRFPKICKTVNQRYLKYKADLRSKILNKAKLSALNFFTSEKYSQYSQSRKQAYRVLRRETNLPKFVLIKAIEEAYQAIHS